MPKVDKQENKWKIINKEITINQGTLDAFGEYVDFVRLIDEKISIRLTVKKT